MEGDVCRKEDVNCVVEKVVNEFGRFDIFINGVVGNFLVVFEDFFLNGFKIGNKGCCEMLVVMNLLFWMYKLVKNVIIC